jgi:outer membrane protein TolC
MPKRGDKGVRGRQRFYRIGLFVVFLIFSPRFLKTLPAQGPPEAGRLTLGEAVETALASHPSLLASKAAYRLQEARLGEVRSNLFPDLNLRADYNRATANFAPTTQTSSSLNQIISRPAPSNDSFNDYSASLSLQQRIFDFGKTGADVQAAREGLQGSAFDDLAARQTVVENVKVAYFGLLAARRLVRVDEETVRQFQEHLRQAEGFFSVGTRPKFDVTKAEVDLTNAELNLIKAKNGAEVARVTLANAMGTPDRPIGEMEELLDFQRFDITEEKAVEEALSLRPELLSQKARERAGEALVRSARRNRFPVLSGSADYTYRGQDFPLVWNWDVGLSLSFPIFSGYLIESQVAEARANLASVGANAEILRQSILLEVRQAYLDLKEAEERVRTSEIVVRQAEENLALANGRFAAGVGTSVERTDAQVLLTNAKTSQLQALYDYRVAEARLQKAMGRE